MDTLQESIANLRQQVNTSGSGKSAETTVTVNGRACTLKAEAKTFLWFKWTQITINTSLSDRTCEVAKFSYNRGKDLANKIEEIKTKLNTFEEGQKSSVDESEGPETAEEASLEAGEWDELNIDNKKVKDEAGSGTPVAKTATPQVSSEPPAKPASPEIARYIQQIVDCKTISYSISRNKSNDFQEVNALLDNIENFVQENRNNLSEEDMVNLKSALQGLLNKLLLNTGDRFGTRSIKETADSGDKDCSSIMTRVKSIETQLDAKLKENTPPGTGKTTDAPSRDTPVADVAETAIPQVSSEPPAKPTFAAISKQIADFAKQSISISHMDAPLQGILTFLEKDVTDFVNDSENLTRDEISTLKQKLQELFSAQIIGSGNFAASIQQMAATENISICNSIVSLGSGLTKKD